MSVAGFDEAYESSITARLNSDPELDIRLPTLPGLALLKIISWADRYPERSKDAEDLALIMQQYDQAGNLGRLYDREWKLLEEEAFDTRLAGIRLLGRDSHDRRTRYGGRGRRNLGCRNEVRIAIPINH